MSYKLNNFIEPNFNEDVFVKAPDCKMVAVKKDACAPKKLSCNIYFS